MGTLVQPSDFLKRGTLYLFRYNSPRQSDPLPGDVEAAVSSWEGSSVSQITVTLPSSSELDVSFMYNGDGTDTVSSQSSEIMNAIADSDPSLAMISFASGAADQIATWPTDTTGGNLQTHPTGGILQSLQDMLDALAKALPTGKDISSSLWAIAIIGGLLIFFLSGGVTATRRVVG